ncbi:MAG TPA: ABC transporter ATP-binding protein [Acidimicrobiales bacterium]|nr:ABC transporter ATP-binding protein [Acidimicrobiales bacterium]
MAVAFAGVTKEHEPGRAALRHLTLDIDDGTICCLIGPSGCGKSTALRILAGLDEPTDGEVRLGRRRVNDVPTRDRGLGMVTQDVSLLPRRPTEDSIALPLELRRVDVDERRRRVHDQALELDIVDLLRRRPETLSGGEAQVAQIARAVIARPAVLLLDEPLARVDPARRAAVRGDLVRLQRLYGVTTVWVTADQAEALAVADRLAVLLDGRLQQAGPPLEVYRQPRTVDVARFVGEPEVNLLPGRVVGVPGDLWVEVAGARCRLRAPAAARLAGGPATVGLRPHELHEPGRPGDGADAVVAAGTVLGVETHGPHVVATVDLGGTVVRWDRAPLAVRTGDHVALVLDPARFHLFDPHTGVALHHPE